MPTMKNNEFSAILNVYKPVGISPLDAINLIKEKHPALKNEKMTYAGRLDPMAEGVLLILAEKAVYEKDKYLKLDKEYEGEILFGFETDTYDILGMPKSIRQPTFTSRTVLGGMIKKLEGELALPLPPYSSYKIKGKSLFQWTREGKLDEIEIPMRQIKINSAEMLNLNEISGEKLLEIIEQKISLTKGDFRQKEILERWRDILKNDKTNYQIVKIKINCSSGTYIRSIAHHLGEELKIDATLFSCERSELENKKYSCGGILLNLKRTQVGKFNIKDSLRI